MGQKEIGVVINALSEFPREDFAFGRRRRERKLLKCIQASFHTHRLYAYTASETPELKDASQLYTQLSVSGSVDEINRTTKAAAPGMFLLRCFVDCGIAKQSKMTRRR